MAKTHAEVKRNFHIRLRRESPRTLKQRHCDVRGHWLGSQCQGHAGNHRKSGNTIKCRHPPCSRPKVMFMPRVCLGNLAQRLGIPGTPGAAKMADSLYNLWASGGRVFRCRPPSQRLNMFKLVVVSTTCEDYTLL